MLLVIDLFEKLPMAETWLRRVRQVQEGHSGSTQCVHGSEHSETSGTVPVQKVHIVMESSSAEDLRITCPGCQCYVQCPRTLDPALLQSPTVIGKEHLLYNEDCGCTFCSMVKEDMRIMHNHMEDYASAVLLSCHCGEDQVRAVRSVSCGSRWWKSEDYAVKKDIIMQVLGEFHLKEEDMTDIFSTVWNARFQRRCEGDAWRSSWSPPLCCWWNPPYSRLQDAVLKLILDESQGIFVAPAWDSDWLKLLKKISVKNLYFDIGSHIFELMDKEIGPVRWGVYFFLLQKKEQISEAKKRRQRREKEKEKM